VVSVNVSESVFGRVKSIPAGRVFALLRLPGDHGLCEGRKSTTAVLMQYHHSRTPAWPGIRVGPRPSVFPHYSPQPVGPDPFPVFVIRNPGQRPCWIRFPSDCRSSGIIIVFGHQQLRANCRLGTRKQNGGVGRWRQCSSQPKAPGVFVMAQQAV